jgi:streptogramin lyase
MYEFDPSGAQVFPPIPYTGPTTGLSTAVGAAIDHAGNVWVANGGGGSSTGFGVAEFSKNGTLLSLPGFANLAGDDTPSVSNALAVDGDGHVFVAHKKFVSELNNDGSLVKTSAFYSDPSLNGTYSIAIDGSGNVWVANFTGNTLTEFVGLAAPVVTPIAAGVANSTLGTRP